jgi:cytochrome c-type biogenesis protein CcmH
LRQREDARGADAGQRDEANLAAWRSARTELDAQLADGRIDRTEHVRAGREIDRRLLAETDSNSGSASTGSSGSRAILALALAVPLLAVVLYSALGAWREVQLDGLLGGLDDITDPAQRTEYLLSLLPRLETAARSRDEDGSYRFMLARTYMTLERFPEAAAVYAELVGQYPEDAALIAQQAQALYLAANRELTPAIQALVDRAFAIDPAQVTLLGMIGMDRFQRGDFAGAVAAWEKLLAQLPADAPDAAVIRDGIAMARARLGGDAAAPAHDAGSVAAAAGEGTHATADGAGTSLRVAVSLADGLSAPPDATVFVFARAVAGPPMPLAVARFAAAELPKEVELNDAMAMAPGLTLSRFREVKVTARITRSGTVTPAVGDFEGSSDATTLGDGASAVAIVIDRVL